MTREELFKNLRTNISSMETEELFRQTGRTTRMIEDAIATAKRGRPVLILAKDEYQKSAIRQQVGGAPGVAVENVTYPVIAAYVDWDRLAITGGEYVSHQVFFDHDTIYCHFRNILRAFGKYDPKVAISGDTMRFVSDDEINANKTRLHLLIEKLTVEHGSEKAAFNAYRGMFSNATGGFTPKTIEKVFQDYGI